MVRRDTASNVRSADVHRLRVGAVASSPPASKAGTARPGRAVRTSPARGEAAAVGDLGVDTEGRSLRRGLAILEAVARGPAEGLRVVELCRSLGLGRATVHRLLATLLDTGHLARHGRWHLVPGAHWSGAPAAAMPAPSDLAARLQPVLEQVSAACGDPSFAVVREGHSSWCITRAVGTHPIQILAVQVGHRQPLGVGAAGLALLAALPPAEAAAATASHGALLERYGGMTAERMALLVRASRERGWAIVGNHAVSGVLGVGMAVRETDGTLVAAISVAAPMDRMTGAHQRLIVRAMRSALRSHDFQAGDG